MDEALKPYKHLKEELTIVDGLVLRGDRLVIPEKLQQTVVDIVHSSHQGIVKTKALLRETLWFPGMDRKVELHCYQVSAMSSSNPYSDDV